MLIEACSKSNPDSTAIVVNSSIGSDVCGECVIVVALIYRSARSGVKSEGCAEVLAAVQVYARTKDVKISKKAGPLISCF